MSTDTNYLYKLAFIGLGAIGKPISKRLSDHGFKLSCFSRSRQLDPNENFFRTPFETVQDTDGLLICVSDDSAVEKILFGEDGAVYSLRKNSFVIDLSTISPYQAERNYERLKKINVNYLDCPVSGGTEGATNGSLAMFVGGDKEVFLRLRFLLNIIAKSINYFGNSGSGQKVKALNQVLVAGTYAAVAEAIALGKELNLPMSDVIEALSQGAASSWPLANRSDSMLKDDHPLGFKLSLHYKDLLIAIELADSVQLELPISSKVKDIEENLIKRGYGDLDVSVLHRFYKNNTYDNY